jgi:3-dehydroquinate synthase
MATIPVETPSAPYVVEFGRGLLDRSGELVRALGDATGVFFLSSPRVWKHWGTALQRSFRPRRKARGATAGPPQTILFGDGEPSKALRTVEAVCRQLVRAGADRGAVLVALGGGVVGDVAGFVAASYLRGVRLVHVPTTLVALVDSAIGGKTGVNLPEGKNLVGAFYQPALVIADPVVLKTLPPRQYRSGLYEVVKYGVIGDRHLFEFLEQRMDQILAGDRAALDWILPRCISAKADVVARDEREGGRREILNFGHTVGHALESLTRYRRFLHGEAVGWGMIAAARLAAERRMLERSEARRIEALVRRIGPLPGFPAFPAARWIVALRVDKKSRGGKLRFILPRRIGAVEGAEDMPERLVTEMAKRLAAEGKS